MKRQWCGKTLSFCHSNLCISLTCALSQLGHLGQLSVSYFLKWRKQYLAYRIEMMFGGDIRGIAPISILAVSLLPSASWYVVLTPLFHSGWVINAISVTKLLFVLGVLSRVLTNFTFSDHSLSLVSKKCIFR